MQFKLKSVSKHGIAFYQREGFKQAVSVPRALLGAGDPPAVIEVGGEGVTFAEKTAAVRATGLDKTLKALPKEQAKQIRAAGRKAMQDALAKASSTTEQAATM